MYSRALLKNIKKKERKAGKNLEKISISTSYFAGKNISGAEIVHTIKDLGFSNIEPNVNVSEAQLKEIIKSYKKGKINISSMHSICPQLKKKPSGKSIYSAYQISSLDEHERKKGVKYIINNIRLAEEVGAECVVLHAGEVETNIKSREMHRLYKKEGESERFIQKRAQFVRERNKKAEPYFEKVLKSLDELSKALDSEVKIGLETRSFYHEIPSLNEFEIIFKEFGNDYFYWHDTGHAQLQSKFGFEQSAEIFIDKFKSRLAGIHFHDLIGIKDHLPPGTGEIDFSYLSPLMDNDGILCVLEVHPGADKKDIKNFFGFCQKLNKEKEDLKTNSEYKRR